MVRRDDHRARALRAAGAEVAVGSLDHLDDVRRAMSGVQRAYVNTPFSPWALQAATHLAIAAEEHHLEAVVVMSQWLAHPTHPSAHTRNAWLADQLFAWMPSVGTVTVNPGFFAENYLPALQPISQLGVMSMPLGRGRNAPPSNEDIARVVVAVLTDPGPHLGKTYRPTGPELLDPDQIAAAFGQALGRRVRYRDVPFTLLAKVAKSIGFSDYAIEQLRWYIDDYRADAFAAGAPTDAVATLTGRDPEPFHAIVRRHADADPHTRPGPGNLAHALGVLTRAITTPAPRLHRLVEVSELPHDERFSLAATSPEWAAGHPDASTAVLDRQVPAAVPEATAAGGPGARPTAVGSMDRAS
jgi:NAD(P)H dehydrogenase (quinone)